MFSGERTCNNIIDNIQSSLCSGMVSSKQVLASRNSNQIFGFIHSNPRDFQIPVSRVKRFGLLLPKAIRPKFHRLSPESGIFLGIPYSLHYPG
ncbi:hypothetical protein MSMTP_0573 [Methanosarcina sp. MTP4]|nr:hypothetical protein MSMTP_0573 [Methanosarcina sp. MTP4]